MISVLHSKIYRVRMIADKGTMFLESLIRETDVLDDREIDTLQILNGGKSIMWDTTINYDLTNEQYRELFRNCIVVV